MAKRLAVQRNPNPMHSRCGEEGCDCGYTISKLQGALEWALRHVYVNTADDLTNYEKAGTVLKEARR